MSRFQVVLLQPNAHWKDGVAWDLVPLCPHSGPVRLMTLMENMRRGNFTVAEGCMLGDRASYSPVDHETAGNYTGKGIEQHGECRLSPILWSE
jgi:hypothetical protein